MIDSNAIKFSSKDDKIITKVNVTQVKSEIVEVEISVQDFGIGINEYDQTNLFKPYFVTTDTTSK